MEASPRIAYLVGGDPGAPKERIEVFGGGAIGTIDDFRQATIRVGGRRRTYRKLFGTQDKGHRMEVKAFIDALVDSAPPPVSFASAVNATHATFAILTSLQTENSVDLTDC